MDSSGTSRRGNIGSSGLGDIRLKNGVGTNGWGNNGLGGSSGTSGRDNIRLGDGCGSRGWSNKRLKSKGGTSGSGATMGWGVVVV